MANGTASSALTLRKDSWWVAPLVTGVVLGAFGIYSTWRALANEYFFAEPYLSPFYSPLILSDWWPFSPGLTYPLGAAWIPRDLLLLQKSILPCVFPLASGLRVLNQSAKWVLTRGNRVSRSFCRTSTGFFSTRLLLSCSFCGLTRFKPFSSMTGSESASEPYFLLQTRFCSACIRFLPLVPSPCWRET